MLDSYSIITIIASTMVVYYIKLYSDDLNIRYLLLSIIFSLLLLFTSYQMFSNKNNSFIFVSICIKILPIILLTLISIYVLQDREFKLYTGIGILFILGGTLLIE
jgi:hypothetical protein